MAKQITVNYPLDKRPKEFRNELLDGKNHDILVEQVSTFEVEGVQFYLVYGFDTTRGISTEILLIKDGGTLRKVPLLDYNEISLYATNIRELSRPEMQSILDRNNNYILSMPLTSIADLVAQAKQEHPKTASKAKAKIIVFYDEEGRKFITADAAKYLGLPNPESIKYIPIKNEGKLASENLYFGPHGYRLLTETEHAEICSRFEVRREEVNEVDVIECEGNFYVRRIIYENNAWGLAHAFYNFGDSFFDCVRLSAYQKSMVDKYYSTRYQKRKLLSIDGDPSRIVPEHMPEETSGPGMRV